MRTLKRHRMPCGTSAALSALAVMLACICVLAAAGCSPEPLDNLVLPAVQEVPDRQPPAARIQVKVANESGYRSEIQVDCFVADTLVHHSEAVLAPAAAGGMLLVDWDEADRVVLDAVIRDDAGQTLFSESRIWLLDADFSDGDILEYTLSWAPANQPPVVSVSAPATAQAGQTVTLDGSYTYDPDGDPLTWQWEQVTSPVVQAPQVTLSGADAAVATFVAPAAMDEYTLRFRLTTSDGELAASDEVTIIVVPAPNRPPVAVVAEVEPVAPETLVSLDGLQSYDPDDDPLTFQWEQISGTPVSLSDDTEPVATFTSPAVSVAETLVFRLTVSDGRLTAASEVQVVVENSPMGQ